MGKYELIRAKIILPLQVWGNRQNPKLICLIVFLQLVPPTEALRGRPGCCVFVYASRISGRFLPKSAQPVLFQLWAVEGPPTLHRRSSSGHADLTDCSAAYSVRLSHHQRHRNTVLSGSLMPGNRSSRAADNGESLGTNSSWFYSKGANNVLGCQLK